MMPDLQLIKYGFYYALLGIFIKRDIRIRIKTIEILKILLNLVFEFLDFLHKLSQGDQK